MFPRSEFRSIWEIAHNWSERNPSEIGADELPEDVEEYIQIVIWAYIRKHISLRRKVGPNKWHRIPDEDILLFLFNLNRARVKLRRMLETGTYDRTFLENVYVTRADVLRWCEETYRDASPMWRKVPPGEARDPGKAQGQLTCREIDKQRCQAIALTLWDVDLRIHPAHMVQSLYIQKFGNGAQYRDDETVKGWIAEVDPLKKQRKPGRPPAAEYNVDLKMRVPMSGAAKKGPKTPNTQIPQLEDFSTE